MITLLHKTITGYFNLEEQQLFSKSRKKHIVVPRQIFCYFARRYTLLTLTEIMNYLKFKNHTTIVHAIRTINNYMDTEKEFKLMMENINQIIIENYTIEFDREQKEENQKKKNILIMIKNKINSLLKILNIF